MKKHEYPLIGIVSHGTMRSEDLIPDFMDVLEVYNPKRAKVLRSENPDIFTWLEDPDTEEPEFTSEFLNETLWDALNEIAPPYCYFGATEGDGTDYGFWPCFDAIQEDGDVLKVNDSSELPKGYIGYFTVTSDHGNLTLYHRFKNGRVNEIWGIV